MTMEPGTKRSVKRGPVDLHPDTDTDDSDTNSASEAEPGFGSFLMNFPYEELPEKKMGQSQPHRMMNLLPA